MSDIEGFIYGRVKHGLGDSVARQDFNRLIREPQHDRAQSALALDMDAHVANLADGMLDFALHPERR
jgi:hypothetical protein